MIKNELFNFENLDKDFDYIIHTLALSNEKYCSDLKNAEKINIEFTKELIYFAKKQNILKKFIFLSSIIIYDNENKPPVSENDKLNFFY
jgi:nucleoside-diphosphate-sugar epimerase